MILALAALAERQCDYSDHSTAGKSVPGGIRTPNLLIRSQKLYPVELQAQSVKSQNPSSKSQRQDSHLEQLRFAI